VIVISSFLGQTDVEALIDDVAAVELTIDGVLVAADRLGLADFPPVLGIRLNIPYPDLRKKVWDQVDRDLTAQGVLNAFAQPHPAVADMLQTLSRSDRTLEGRWWRRNLDGDLTRFAISRRGDRHVIAVRRGDLVVLQRVAATLAQCRTPDQLGQFDISLNSTRVYSALVDQPAGWAEIVATERHPGGTVSRTEAAAGVLDGVQGRIVSIPRRVNGELFGSFLPGSDENLQRAVDGLMEFLPSQCWAERPDNAGEL
jgi:hypothetical protein